MNIQNLIDAYKKMYANVEWHIKTNEPKGSDLQICQEKLSHYTDIIQELESLDELASNGGKEDVNWLSPETKAAIARLAQKHNEIDFCEWVGNNFIQTYSADGSVRWEEKKDSRFYKTSELWNLKSPSPEPPTSDPELLEAVKDWCKEMGEAQKDEDLKNLAWAKYPQDGEYFKGKRCGYYVALKEMQSPPKHNEDASTYIERTITMLKETEIPVAGYNGMVCLLGYAKESHNYHMKCASSLLTQRENTISMFEKLSANQRKMIDSRDETIRELREENESLKRQLDLYETTKYDKDEE